MLWLLGSVIAVDAGARRAEIENAWKSRGMSVAGNGFAASRRHVQACPRETNCPYLGQNAVFRSSNQRDAVRQPRGKANREVIQRGIEGGVFAVFSSDHAGYRAARPAIRSLSLNATIRCRRRARGMYASTRRFEVRFRGRIGKRLLTSKLTGLEPSPPFARDPIDRL